MSGSNPCSPFEITLLKSLDVGKKYPVDEAAKIAGMNRDAVLKAAYLLQEKGFAEVETVIQTDYSLSDEGERYLKEGLPEERVVAALEAKGGEATIRDLEEDVGREDVKIALGWLRR